jgi:hypothetical protein
MSSNRIISDTSGKQLAKMAAIATDRLLDSLAEMRRIKLILDSATTGNDWAALAIELGLTTVGSYTAAQQAQDFWTIWSNATTRIDDAAVLEMKRLDQG